MIVGGGGREHALAWKLYQSPVITEILAVPGNAGISELAKCLDVSTDDPLQLAELAIQHEVDLTIIGPEAPLVSGIVDVFRAKDLRVLGPCKKGALLEGSKAWAKNIMQECGIPTASFEVHDSYEDAVKSIRNLSVLPVIKADGLASGKGVLIPGTKEEAERYLYEIMIEKCFGDAGNQIVLEEKLTGEEASLLAITDGENLTIMPPAQDHKPIGEGDTGPNTGGMGAYSPTPLVTPQIIKQAETNVFRPLLKAFKQKGIDYRGIIYAGLMINQNELNVLEFNVRFGDPEAQVLLVRMDSDLLPLLKSAADGKLQGNIQWKNDAAVCVVLASAGYPGTYEKGKVIFGLEHLSNYSSLTVFHAGTKITNSSIVTSGGRVLGVTSWHPELKEAINRAYQAINLIHFEGCYYRKDIGEKAFK